MLGRKWVFGHSTNGLHKHARNEFNKKFEGKAEEALGYQFGGDAKRLNLQLELFVVNHGPWN